MHANFNVINEHIRQVPVDMVLVFAGTVPDFHTAAVVVREVIDRQDSDRVAAERVDYSQIRTVVAAGVGHTGVVRYMGTEQVGDRESGLAVQRRWDMVGYCQGRPDRGVP